MSRRLLRSVDSPSTFAAVRSVVFAEGPYVAGAELVLADSEAHHLRVVRLVPGDRLAVRDGAGAIAEGVVTELTKQRAVVTLDTVSHVPAPTPIHLLVPVADRDRMLWLAEKVEELNIASWRPVLWQRSRSVSPRGEGDAFRAKIRARMQAALLQSRSAWLPELYPEATPAHAVDAVAVAPSGLKIVLDAGGHPLAQIPGLATAPAVTLAVGPEGGFEPAELEALHAAGFVAATLGASTLRFETAAVAAVAVVRSLFLPPSHP